MARLFSSGFETNNLTATEWTSTSGTAPTIVTTAPHSGTYHLRAAPSANSSFVDRTLAANVTSGTHFCRFYWRTSLVNHSADIAFFRNISNANATSVQLILLTTGKLRLTNAVTATTDDTVDAVSVDTWYRLEVRHLLSDTVGEMEVRLYLGDATTALDTLLITGEDTLNTNVRGYNFGALTSTSTIVFFYDDIAINDDSGTFQNSWPGPGKIAMTVPNGEGATIQWTPLSGTDNALMVDDEPGAPDDSTTYNATSTAGNVDRLTMTDLPSEVPSDATIRLAHVYGRFGGNATTGAPRARLKLWDEGGTLSNGPNIDDVDFNGWPGILATNELLVVDTTGKTKANVADFNVGYEDVTDTAVEQRVTAVWVNFEWLEVEGAARQLVPSAELVGAGTLTV